MVNQSLVIGVYGNCILADCKIVRNVKLVVVVRAIVRGGRPRGNEFSVDIELVIVVRSYFQYGVTVITESEFFLKSICLFKYSSG